MDVLARIIQLKDAKGWSEYQLAERSGLAQSTISSWYRKNMLPTIPSLEKICEAFDITMSEFFIEDYSEAVILNEQQARLIDYAVKLSPDQFDALLHFLNTL